MQRLGKKTAIKDPRTLKLNKYLVPKIPTPSETSWVMKVNNWPMLLNDTIGDCVPAGAAHIVQQLSYYANPPGYVPTDQDVLKAYEVVGGYNPSDPSTDNGADMLTMLKYWRKVGIANHKLLAFVALDPKKRDEVMQAIWLFGNIYVGLQLPANVQGANKWVVQDGGVNTTDGAPGSWGGHCVPIMAASPRTLSCITWGSRLKMSWNFFQDYCDEAYAVLSMDWIDKGGISVSGFKLAELKADLAAL